MLDFGSISVSLHPSSSICYMTAGISWYLPPALTQVLITCSFRMLGVAAGDCVSPCLRFRLGQCVPEYQADSAGQADHDKGIDHQCVAALLLRIVPCLLVCTLGLLVLWSALLGHFGCVNLALLVTWTGGSRN